MHGATGYQGDSDGTVIVGTRSGSLRGRVEHSFEDYDYVSFKGVPYATPPIGELRFQDPLPVKPWSGVREATHYGPICGQFNYVTRSIEGNDDCLYLNIYVKSISKDTRLPVMVWFHGGAFLFGDGSDMLYGPDYFLKKDIVLVTLNYRLGVLGFLNFEDEVAPGNQGLKDQVLALKWVQENIANFSGDPNNVTIFGESAGGASVHYLAMSPLTTGLFHKAISQSGVACNSWACTSNKTLAYRLCAALGNNSTDPKELVTFLRTIDCYRLIEAQENIRSPEERLQATFPFGPGVDKKSKQPLMPIHPSEAAKKGVHVPFILGCNTHEAICSLPGIKPHQFENLDRHFDKYLSHSVILELMQRNNISPRHLKVLYFGTETISSHNTEKFVDLWTDLHFVEGIHKVLAAQVQQSSAPTYFYRFTYDKEFSITKAHAQSSIKGTSHFDEVHFLFSMRLYDILNVERPKPGTPSYRIIEQMVEMWVNFATHGRPTPAKSDLVPTYWLPVMNEKVFRALIINEELRMDSILHIDTRLSFGKHLKYKL